MRGFDRSVLPSEFRDASRLFLSRHEAYRVRRSAARTDVVRLEARTSAATNEVAQWILEDQLFATFVSASDRYRQTMRETAGLKPAAVKRLRRDQAWDSLLEALRSLSTHN